MENVIKRPASLVLLWISAFVLVTMIEGKSITNATKRELHTFLRLQPFEAKPVRVQPDLPKKTVVQQHHQGIEPNVNGANPSEKHGSFPGIWPYDQRLVVNPSTFQINQCPKCETCPTLTACPANTQCTLEQQSCSSQSTACTKCDENPTCPTINKCPDNPSCSLTACTELEACPSKTCDPITACSSDNPYSYTLTACDSLTACPSITACPIPPSPYEMITACGLDSKFVVSSSSSGFIQIPFSSTSPTCTIGIAPPPPYTKVLVYCVGTIPGTTPVIGNPSGTLTVATASVPGIVISGNAIISIPAPFATSGTLTCGWSSIV